MKNKIVLIDGNSIIYRAFFALPLLNNDKGVYTNGVFGFTTMLMRILEEEKPTHVLVAFDAGKTTFRHETYTEYKGGRDKTPSELSEQFPVLKDLLNAFHIKHYELPNYEADDIIGTFVSESEKDHDEVTVISGDKDMLQLVSPTTTVSLTKKGISEVKKYNPETMFDEMEVNPDQIIDLKALMGDKSDNIPGVPGVGEKTAVKLLKEYTTLENVYEHLDDIKGKKLKENLENHKDDAFMSKGLVTIKRDTPVDIQMNDIVYDGYDEQKLGDAFKELGFASLLNKLGDEYVEEDTSSEMKDVDFTIVSEVTSDMFTGEEAILIELLDENYHKEPIQGIGIANEQHRYFIPTEVALQSDQFKQWAEDETKKKVVFDAKKALVSLLNQGIQLKGIEFDLMLSAYILNPAENHIDIPVIAHRMNYLDVQTEEAVYGKGAKKKVPELEVLAEHVVRKTSLLYELKPVISKSLAENNQEALLKELELPLALILGQMEHTGIKVDTDTLKEMDKELTERLDTIEKEIHELAGEEFNVNSPKQLGPILFEKLGLRVIKKTKTGYSTAADVLEQLEKDHEIIPKILLYRQLKKLQSTYTEGLLKVVDKDTHKIHTRFNQALTQTGRLSSTEPNLQNIPIRLEEGRKIRKAFVPSEKDWLMFAADYSQIELRVLAHIAKDEKLIQAFKDDLDIHTQTAASVFHVELDEVTPDMRRQAKAVNFGIVYGISDYGLSQSLGTTRKEAKAFIDKYFEIYPGVKAYMDDIVQEAKHQGYVTTIMHRRRYLPEITSRNFNMRSFAERTAMNTPIQGSAADIIKKAMIDLQTALEEKGLTSRVLIQVHDELILEAPESELATLKELVPQVMENTVDLIVPLKVDYEFGKSWFDAK
ncbi:MAG TPA: DNA polymerase I [Candidatus Avamphibacillus intestinigallinarum]|nr:DNA polymerase I [Candidatus Avamphibacillus intestinigallinarum]